MARISRHRRSGILHHILRHCTQRRNWSHLPRTLSRSCSSIMGVLGLIHRYRLARRACCLLVFDPKYERRQQCQGHDRCYLALVSNTAQRHPRVSGHRNEYDDQLFNLLARELAVFVHASEQP